VPYHRKPIRGLVERLNARKTSFGSFHADMQCQMSLQQPDMIGVLSGKPIKLEGVTQTIEL
jgi:hypothetical protein